MAIRVRTSNPRELLSAIRTAIGNGTIQTWSVDKDGDFTHVPDQWRYKAWLRPSIVGSELQAHILTPKGTTLTKTVYAVYHGRFAEMVLTHFDLSVSSIQLSSLPESGDKVSG